MEWSKEQADCAGRQLQAVLLLFILILVEMVTGSLAEAQVLWKMRPLQQQRVLPDHPVAERSMRQPQLSLQGYRYRDNSAELKRVRPLASSMRWQRRSLPRSGPTVQFRPLEPGVRRGPANAATRDDRRWNRAEDLTMGRIPFRRWR